MSDIERNKANVVRFYEMALNEMRPRDAIEQFVGNDYVQHNLKVPTGKQGFIDYIENVGREWPGMRVTIQRVIAEGSFIVLHSSQVWPGTDDWAAIDIFRVDDDGKIVEHWDVVQAVPSEAAHNNGMF